MIRPDLAYRYPNTGARWTSVEVDLLKSLAGEGAAWRDIGRKVGRTGEACRLKAIEEGFLVSVPRNRRQPTKRQGAACVLS